MFQLDSSISMCKRLKLPIWTTDVLFPPLQWLDFNERLCNHIHRTMRSQNKIQHSFYKPLTLNAAIILDLFGQNGMEGFCNSEVTSLWDYFPCYHDNMLGPYVVLLKS